MKTSVSDNSKYPEVCYAAATSDEAFKVFKSNSTYREILEHVSYEEGLRYQRHFEHNNIITDNLEKFKINDIYGSPHTCDFNIGKYSPTTLRYMSVLSDLTQLNLNNISIVEIGAGYGGQYSVLRQLYKPSKYTFIDLPEVLQLIKRYVNTLKLDDIDLSFLSGSNVLDQTFDLVISNYALSECTKEIQDMYIKSIINKSKHGYIIYNNMEGYRHTEFIERCDRPVKIHREEPNTNPDSVLLTW